MSPRNWKLIEWVRSHSGDPARGPQCARHLAISEMTASQIQDALFMDTGMRRSRQRMSVLFTQEGVKTRGRVGPPRRFSLQEQKAKNSARWQKWYTGTKSDPVRYASYLESSRRRNSLKTEARRARRAAQVSQPAGGE